MDMLEAVVIGGGISGLVAAYCLQRQGARFCIIEASQRLGGLIHSQQEHGFLWEGGPHTFPGSAAEMLNLCAELGLKPVEAEGKKRYLYIHGKLTALPMSPWEAITTPVLSPWAKLRLLREPWIGPCHHPDISVADFVRYRLGSEVAENLLDPFISGIYAGNLEELSLPAVFPKLWQWEQQHGSLLKGARQAKKQKSTMPKAAVSTNQPKRSALLSFSGGLQTLTDALAKRVKSDSKLLGDGVAFMQREGGAYKLHLHSGKWIQAKVVFLAVPAYQAAELLSGISAEASSILHKIQYNDLAVLHVGLPQSQISHALDGFGCLIPRKEKVALLGTIWASSLFPTRAPQGQVLLSNFIGGAHHPEILSWSPQQIENQVLSDLRQIFNIRGDLTPTFSKLLPYKRAIPQYELGHLQRIGQLETCLNGSNITLLGNYLRGIGLNECVKSAEKAVGTYPGVPVR